MRSTTRAPTYGSERPFVSDDRLPTAALLFITSPYAERVWVTSIKFEIAISKAAGFFAAGSVPAISDKKYLAYKSVDQQMYTSNADANRLSVR